MCGKDKGHPDEGAGDKRAIWEERASRAAANIRLAMEDQVRARYIEDVSMDDPVKLWDTIASDRKAVVELDTNYLINQLHGMRM